MPNDKPKQLLIEITRHIAGPPRRAVGDRLWATPAQIKAQGLAHRKDFIVVPPPTAKPKSKDKATAITKGK